jgi:hypothetical protein
MWSAFARPILAIVLSVALAIGLVLHTARAGDMGMIASAAMSTTMPMPDKCDRCGRDKDDAPALCSAYCTVVFFAMPAVTLYAVPIASLARPADLTSVGYSEPPDPYPPRRASLS